MGHRKLTIWNLFTSFELTCEKQIRVFSMKYSKHFILGLKISIDICLSVTAPGPT